MPSPPTSSGHSNPGRMDTKSVSCVVNSISRFIHLVSCQTIQTLPTLKSYKNIASVLKLLKPVLDDIVDYKVPSDKVLCKECEELDVAVNEAREFMESWSSKMSKICSVLKSEPLVMKIQSSSLEICRILCRLLHSSPSTSSFTGVQHCMQELQCLKLERISECIEEAVKVQRAGMVPPSEHLITIVNSLGLTSNQELLKESIALEKERMMAHVNKVKGEIDQIYIIIDLMSHIRDCMVKHERFKAVNGVRIPSYFRCPLSLELMKDPVIVASGQTYDRTSIQKWLDNGLSLCPKSHQILSHTNLIPNFTVKALIANWCEENHIKFPNIPELANTNMPAITQSEDASCQDLIRMDSFHSSHSNDSTSRSSHEVGNGFQKLKTDAPFRFNEQETNGFRSREPEIFDHSSPEQSYVHSRSESASSAISSVDYLPAASTDVSRISSKHENASELSGEMISECPIAPLNKNSEFYPRLSERVCRSSKTMAEMASNGNSNYPRTLSLPSEGDDLTTTSHVEKLVEDLKSQAYSVQTSAAAELRFLAKHNTENRVIIGCSGAIAPLLSLLYTDMKLTQEHAVTALLNLSISEDIKARIAEAGAIEPLIHVLRTGNARSKENAAAALFSLSLLEEYKMKIGRSSAVKALVDLLETGTLRGKKDAATALFNLSIFHENKARIVQAGAVKYLVELLNPETEMVDKAVALLANLSTIAEGCTTIARAGGIPFLVEVIETGSQRGKENAASILFQLCINSPKFCRLVLQEGAVPPLVALSQSGTPRAKEKAQQLLSHFRNQREGPMGKGK